MTGYYRLIPDGDEEIIVEKFGFLDISSYSPCTYELLTHDLRCGLKDIKWPNEPPLFYTIQQGYKTSKLCNDTNWLIISNEVKDKINEYGFDGIGYYPISLKDNSNYQFVMNIENAIPCLDHEQSKYKLYGDKRPDRKGDISVLYKIALDKEKIPKNLNIFRLKEYNVVIIVTKIFKDFWEGNNFTGFSFWEI